MARQRRDDDIKTRLLDAAGTLMRTKGLARVTTRDIARTADVAEGTLYNHFQDKSTLLVAMLARAAPETMREVMQELPLLVGCNTVSRNLETVLGAVLAFHRQAAPVICSLLADAELMVAGRAALVARGIGPSLSAERLAAYLAAEQRLGRVAGEIDAAAAVELLLGASFKTAVADHLFATRPSPAREKRQVRALIDAALRGLQPR